MKIRKQIKRFGNSVVITLSAENLNLHKLKVGDVVDIEINKVKEKIR